MVHLLYNMKKSLYYCFMLQPFTSIEKCFVTKKSQVLLSCKECILSNFTSGLLGHVCQYDKFKCAQILNMSNVWHEKFKWSNTYGGNGWTQGIQLLVFRQIRPIRQNGIPRLHSAVEWNTHIHPKNSRLWVYSLLSFNWFQGKKTIYTKMQ